MAPVKRVKIAKEAKDLHDPFKNVLNFLADHSRLFGVDNDDRKEDFTGWVLQIYRELVKNEVARIIMRIVSCASKVVIIYMPDHNNISDIKNKEAIGNVIDGVTYARVEQIIIAAKDYDNEENRDRLKGLIIHELCHFAVYETFCNGYDAFYSNDDIYKTKWIAAIQKCEENRNLEKLIDEAFDYPEGSWLQKLVVRFFQYHVQYQDNEQKLREFKNNFPKLCGICENYVLENFKVEYEKIRAIRAINQCVTMSEDSPAIRCDISFNPSHNTQIIKSNNTALMANYIFYEFEKVENFKGKFVFLNSNYLSAEDNFEKFKHAALRRAKCTFIIDCDDENFLDIETVLKEEIDRIAGFKKIVVLLGEHQNFEIKTDFESKVNFIPSHLTDKFFNGMQVNFQGRDMSLVELITVAEYQTLATLPTKKMNRGRISIGNQMELKLITEYVEQNFLIQNQSIEKWDKFNDFGDILTKNKRVLVANEPGAGKSIESIKLYYRLKEKYPKDWIVHINLSRLVEVFEEKKEKFHTYSQSEKFKTFFCRSILKLNEFECDLFEFLMISGRVILIFDSLDEISPFYFSLVSNLTETIFLTFSDQRIIIFTRPHLVIEMEEFKFIIVKIDEFEENARNNLILNILKKKCARKSEEARNDMKKSVQSFLQKRNFHTPLLIRMVTEVASMKILILDKMTLYNIYKHFCSIFDQLQEDKNEDIKEEKLKLGDIDKYFQKCAIEKLFEHRVSSEFESFNHERIETSKQDLISLKDDFFITVKVPDMEKLQRKGITIHSKSNPKVFEFIHASFIDFYIADFIVSEIKSLVRSHKNSLMEIFSMLIQESRLNNVIEFLKGNEDVAENLKEFEVIYQLIDDKKVQDGVNIMPVIKFIAQSIARNSFMRNICKKNVLYTSMILFTDPIKTLEKLRELAPRSFVYENVLMNRPYIVNRCYESDYHAINILDTLAQCGKKDSFGFYVSKDVFIEYFNKLTLDHFKCGQIASMMDVLPNTDNNRSEKCNRSFFLMTKNQNKIVIETFLNFYERLLEEDSYFSDPQFSNFMSILILNNESDHKSLKILTEKISNLNKKSVRELFSCSESKLGVEWGNTIRENIEHFRGKTSPEQFKKAINFYIDIFENVPDGSHSDQQALFWYKFILTLLDEHLFDKFKVAINRLDDRYGNANSMLRKLLMKKDDEGMTILQKVCCLNTTENKQITDFTFNYYKTILGCDASEIHNLFLEPEFFITLILAQNDNSLIISSILKVLNKAENEKDSWLDLMISYSHCFGLNLIDALLKERRTNTSNLSCISFTDKHPELPKLLKKILHKCLNSQNYSKVIYEIFSNKFLTKDQLSDILNALFFKDDILESQISQVLSYKHPEDRSTIIIAASKCEQEGRIEILMKILESYSDTELFKSCLLATDHPKGCTNNGRSALFYLLRNKHQEHYFLTLFDKVESYHGNDWKKADRKRDLIISKTIHIPRRLENIIYETLIISKDDISEEKFKILEKLFKEVLSRDEQKKLIFEIEIRYISIKSFFGEVVEQSCGISRRFLNLTLKTLYENESLYYKVLQKFKRFPRYRGRLLVNADMFLSAFDYYKLKDRSKVVNRLHMILFRSKSIYSYNLSIGNFQYFREDRVIRYLISEIKNDKYSDEVERNLMITFIFVLTCDEYVPLLENARKETQNNDQSKKMKFLFSLLKSMKLNIEEMEVFFETEGPCMSPFESFLQEHSYQFHEFLDFIESMCVNKTEFCTFLASHLSEKKYSFGNNIFHEIIYKSQKIINSTLFFDIYEILKIKLGDSKLLNDLQIQTNDSGETPIMLALRCTNIENCLKFFSENLVKTSMRDLLDLKNSLNDISLSIFTNIYFVDETIYNDFESIIKPLTNYFENSEINEMFKKLCTIKYRGNRNFIHELFELKLYLQRKDQTELNKYLSLLFDEIKKRFGIYRLTELILEADEDNKTPLEKIYDDEPFMPYLKLIEKHFDTETIRTLLSKNKETYNWILYKVLRYKSAEEIMFTVQFCKKYFTKKEFENILIKAFETSDYDGNKLMHDNDWHKRLFSRLITFFEIISDNIHDTECIKSFFSQANKDGLLILAISSLKYLDQYLRVVKLTELYFSRDVVKHILEIENSIQLQEIGGDVIDYEHSEMIELIKEYNPDKWTRVFVGNQVKSIYNIIKNLFIK